MKVCSLYGAGFYYMPGTDMCIKIGGWVRMELTGGNAFNGNMTTGALNALANTRATSNVGMRARGYITADAREQTAYGVARAYIAAGVNTNDTGLQVTSLVDSVNRAFVQWAGFTGGLAVSFYDFYSVPAMTYRGGYMPGSDTGDPGWWVLGYTAQFGGGFSGTLALEQRRTTQICDANAPASAACTIAPGSYTGGSAGGSLTPGNGAYGGEQIPDIVGNLRVDQAWGSAQVMGAYHDVNATYYSTSTTATSAPSILGGHPSDAAGFAVGAGLKVNFPMVAPGDYFQSQFNYTQGALRYVFATDNYNYGAVNGANEAYGIMTDCVYGGTVAGSTGTGCQLTSAWGVNAGYEHYWTPQWHQSLFGAYAQVNYGASGNAMLCADEAGLPATAGSATAATAGCNNNWSTWTVGSRLQWDVTKSFYVGVEALYTAMNGATSSTGTLPSAVALTSAGAMGYQASASAWAFTLRMHKDFLP